MKKTFNFWLMAYSLMPIAGEIKLIVYVQFDYNLLIVNIFK
ncbi:hypothetical protein ACWA1C_15655 [Flectobacillus roseus]